MQSASSPAPLPQLSQSAPAAQPARDSRWDMGLAESKGEAL